MIVACTSMAVVGARRYGFYYFPVWTAVARISVSTFLTRLGNYRGDLRYWQLCEDGSGACWQPADALPMPWDSRTTAFWLLLCPGSHSRIQWFLSNVLEMERSATRTHRAGELALQVVLPIVLWLVAELRSRKSKKHVKKVKLLDLSAGSVETVENKLLGYELLKEALRMKTHYQAWLNDPPIDDDTKAELSALQDQPRKSRTGFINGWNLVLWPEAQLELEPG